MVAALNDAIEPAETYLRVDVNIPQHLGCHGKAGGAYPTWEFVTNLRPSLIYPNLLTTSQK